MYSLKSAFHASVVLTIAWKLKPIARPSPWKLPFVRDYANIVASVRSKMKTIFCLFVQPTNIFVTSLSTTCQ
jgi:hypothetical protein